MLAGAPILTGTITGDGTSTTLTQTLSPTLSVPEQAGGILSTGCRVGELHLVNRASIDWDHRTIRVHGKGNKERDVYLGSKAVLRLRQYLKERDDQNPALFATERNPHRRMSIHQLQYVMKRIAKRTGLGDRVSPHVLRHTMATQMHNRGASIDVLQSLLGHDDPKTTRIYAAMSGKRRHEAFERYFPD